MSGRGPAAAPRGAGALSAPVVVAAAAVVALATVVIGERKPMLLVLPIGALVAVWAALTSRAIVALLVPAYFAASSIAVTKGLIAGGGVYAPAIELTLSDVCLAVLLPVWLWRRPWRTQPRADGERVVRWAVFAYFAWTWIRALTGIVPGDGLLAAVSLSKYGLAFFVMLDMVNDAATVRRILTAVTAMLMVHFTWIAAQFATRRLLLPPGAKANTRDLVLSYAGATAAFRPTGLMLHPNTMSSYLLLVIPVAVLLVLVGRARLGRVPHSLSLLVALGAIGSVVVMLTRGAWIALAVIIPLGLVLAVRRGLLARRQVIRLALAGIAVLCVVPIAYPKVLLRLTRSDARSLESRFLMNRQALMIIRGSPIAGVGLAGYPRAVRLNRPTVFASYDTAYVRGLEAGIVHNHYLFTWAERGAIGVLLLLLVYASALRAAWRARAWVDPALQAVTIGLAVGLVGELMVFGSDPFSVDSRSGYLWTALALLLALLRLQAAAVSAAVSAPAPLALPAEVP